MNTKFKLTQYRLCSLVELDNQQLVVNYIDHDYDIESHTLTETQRKLLILYKLHPEFMNEVALTNFFVKSTRDDRMTVYHIIKSLNIL
ncbi:hypothetical protein ACWE0M_08635 [Staphylococcus xylosus]